MDGVPSVVVALVVFIVVFLICREIVCWYWKINESIGLQIEIRDLLKLIAANNGITQTITSTHEVGDSPTQVPNINPISSSGTWLCGVCSQRNDADAVVCKICQTKRK